MYVAMTHFLEPITGKGGAKYGGCVAGNNNTDDKNEAVRGISGKKKQ